jgi:hypothetical protein
MLRRVALVRTDVSKERIASVRVTRIGKLGTLAVTSNLSGMQTNILARYCECCLRSSILVTLMMEAIHSSETSVLTRATWCNIPENAMHHSSAVKTSNFT